MFLIDYDQLGFQIANGDLGMSSRGYLRHVWLQHGNLVVDITADQFDDLGMPPVIVSRFSTWHQQIREVKLHDQGHSAWLAGAFTERNHDIYRTLRTFAETLELKN